MDKEIPQDVLDDVAAKYVDKEKYRDKSGKHFSDFIEAWVNDKEIPKDALDYVASRLADVLAVVDVIGTKPNERNNPVVTALGLSGREDTNKKHFVMGWELAVLEYKYRHKKNPEAEAIEQYCKDHSYKPGTVKKYYQKGVVWNAVLGFRVYAENKGIPRSKKKLHLPHNYKQLINYFRAKANTHPKAKELMEK